MDIIILSLAVWRVTSLLVSEDGPFNVFAKMRYLLGVRYNERSEPYGLNVVSEMLLCVWCASLWVALFAAIMYIFLGTIIIYVSLPFALSTGAVIIEKIVAGE
jgi:type IV secretory pathway VirB3-like protein